MGCMYSERAWIYGGGRKATSEVTYSLKIPLFPGEKEALLNRKNCFTKFQRPCGYAPFVTDFEMTPNDTSLWESMPLYNLKLSTHRGSSYLFLLNVIWQKRRMSMLRLSYKD